MNSIYLDNSATSFPKPPSVIDAMVHYATDCGASAGRGAYQAARDCGEMIALCRSRLATLIGAEDPTRIALAMNCSEALNIAIRGLLNTAPEGSHAIATAMEHNSVLRPLNALAQQTGLSPEYIACDSSTGLVDPEDIRRAIRPETKLIACVHVSNVTGTMQPVAEVARIAREHGIPFVVDAAQSVGHVPIDVQEWGASFVAFPGHKGLLGPLGTGALYIAPGMEDILPTMKEGGTGSISELAVQPEFLPDKYEIGSHNAMGLAGLSAGVAWLMERGVDSLRAHDMQLSERFMAGVAEIAGVTMYGPTNLADRTGVFSVNVGDLSPSDLSHELEQRAGLCTRPGIHCAPLAHQTIGTHPRGTCRFSFGPTTTMAQVDIAIETLGDIATDNRCN